MITTNRVLLSTSSEDIMKDLQKFEAIEMVSSEEQAEEIWSLNKTPVIFDRGTLTRETLSIPFPVIIPEKFTKWCYKNGFEPGEYTTGQKIDTRIESCVLCGLVGHKAISRDTRVYNAHVKEEVDMILYESPNFIVVPELGAIKPGYLMIVPKVHEYLSIAQLPSMYMPEYEQVCRDVEYILKGAFGRKKPVSFFEHGSGPSGFTSHAKSIVHAHVHVVIDFELKRQYLDMVQMKHCPDISVAAHTHYFAYKVGADGERLCCFDDSVYVQRQFPRQIMAMEVLGVLNLYNWRKTPFLENVHTTLYRCWEFLSTERNIIERVKERTQSFVVPYGNRADEFV